MIKSQKYGIVSNEPFRCQRRVEAGTLALTHIAFAIATVVYSLDQLETDTTSTQFFVRVFTISPFGIKYCKRFGKFVIGKMMITNNKIYPLTGANVFWQNTSVGTVTDMEGNFQLQRVSDTDWLIISHIGFKTDTLKVETSFISHQMGLNEVDELAEVKLTQRRKEIQKSYIETQNILKVSSEELLKAACCNLSESFETNPAIDVNFDDAISGT